MCEGLSGGRVPRGWRTVVVELSGNETGVAVGFSMRWCSPMEANLKSSGFSLDVDAAILSMENISVFHL